MRRVASALAAAVLGLSVVVQAQPADSEVEQFLRQYEAAHNSGDAKALAALHSEDVLRLRRDGPLPGGRAEIEREVSAGFAGPRKGARASLRLGRVKSLEAGVRVVEGTFEVTGGSTPVRGHYLLTLAREGGQWRIASVATVADPSTGSK